MKKTTNRKYVKISSKLSKNTFFKNISCFNRWDIQRLREITYCEKLKARQHGAGRNKKTEPDSLLPMPEVSILVCGFSQESEINFLYK